MLASANNSKICESNKMHLCLSIYWNKPLNNVDEINSKDALWQPCVDLARAYYGSHATGIGSAARLGGANGRLD